MQPLPPTDYARAVPLVNASGMRGHLALVYEVIEERKEGIIYVDTPLDPHTAIVCNQTGFYFAFGEPDEDQVWPVLEGFLRKESWPYVTSLFGSTAAWKELLDRVLLTAGLQREPRLAFEQVAEPPAADAPHGFRLEPITERLAQAILDGTGTGGFGIDPWFIQIAGGAKAYADMGLGLALVSGDQIASICGVCALAHGEVELEVGTAPDYRGRGLAVIVTQAFMRQCRAHGLTPAYSCASDNLPSIGVAHKLGYREVEEISGYRLSR